MTLTDKLEDLHMQILNIRRDASAQEASCEEVPDHGWSDDIVQEMAEAQITYNTCQKLSTILADALTELT